MDDLDRDYLSACQLGITLASLGIGFLGEPAVADLLEPLFGDVLATASRSRSRSPSPTCSSPSLHITIGEQVPKIYAISATPSRSRAASRARCTSSRVLFRPFIACSTASRNGILRLIGIDTDKLRRGRARPEEIQLLIAAVDDRRASSTPARRGC